ncbi:MAG: DNA repair exonuclease [Chloroflexi bacterium]|nr:DNA repair exonuclease [Chloroflexota bacterium]
MPAFKFVHSADLHIDSPIKGLKSRDPIVGKRVEKAGFQALDNLVALCIRESADFLLIAGDAYDGEVPSPYAQVKLRDALQSLADVGIHTYIVHGNHDPLAGRYDSVVYPVEAHFFGSEIEWMSHERDGQTLAQIQGVSYPQRDVTENLAAQFTEPPDSSVFSIGLLHCNLGGNAAHADYAPCSMADLAQKEIEYWALGHVHKRSVETQQFMTVAYSGNIQGRDIGEPGARGCLVVDVNDSGHPSPRFEPLDVVRWEHVQVAIDDLSGIDALRDAIVADLRNAQSVADDRDLICRVTLTGRGALHSDLNSSAAIAGLENLVREEFDLVSPWVWLERIKVNTRTDIDIDLRMEQDDFLGEVLKSVSTTSFAELEPLLSEVFSERADRRNKLSEADVKELQQEAMTYLLDLLEPGAQSGSTS